MLQRVIAAVGRVLDAILPRPPDGDAGPRDAAEAREARERLRVRFQEKEGKGGGR